MGLTIFLNIVLDPLDFSEKSYSSCTCKRNPLF